MNYDEAYAIAQHLVEAMAPYCDRIEIAGSIRRRKPANIKDIEIVAIPKRGVKPDPADLFGVRMIPTDELHDWAMSQRLLTWIKTGVDDIQHWTPKAGGRWWKAIFTPDLYYDPESDVPKIDLFLTDRDRWGATFLIRTGSAEFVPIVMGHAKRVGYEFRGGALCKADGGPQVVVREEADVFRLLGLRYVAPERRTGLEMVIREYKRRG